ncbi:MAG: DUF1328 domain-containing protein [Crocinitomicaceae bacterium]
MFRLSLAFIIVAILAAIFGFTGIATSVAFAAKIIFFIALALLAINLVFGALKKVG